MLERKTILTLKPVGFDMQAERVLSAILDLADFGLLQEWKLVKSPMADYFLVAEGGTEKKPENLPVKRCLFYSKALKDNTENCISVDQESIPSIHAMINALNWAGSGQSQAISAPVVDAIAVQNPLQAPKSQLTEPVESPPAKVGMPIADSSPSADQSSKVADEAGVETGQGSKGQASVADQVSHLALAFPAASAKLAVADNKEAHLTAPAKTEAAKPSSIQDATVDSMHEFVTKQADELNQAFNRMVEDDTGANEPTQKRLDSQLKAKPPQKQETNETLFEPLQGVLKQLLTETVHPFSITIVGRNQFEPVYVNPSQKIFYSQLPVEQIAPYFEGNEVAVTRMNMSDLKKGLKKQDLPPQPLSYLIWYVTYSISKGRRLSGHSTLDFFYLKNTPYRADNNPDYLPLVAFLIENVSNLELAARETGLPLSKAIDLYNASYLVGLVQRATEVGLELKVAHEYFSNQYLDEMLATTMDYELKQKLSKPKNKEKQRFLDKFIEILNKDLLE